MRDKPFTYTYYIQLEKDKDKLNDILENASILKEIDGKLLKKGEFYTNHKEDKLYYVNGYSAKPLKIEVIPIFSKTGVRGTDTITIGTKDQIVKVLDVKKIKTE